MVAFNRLNQAVATGRLVSDAPGVGRIGRMAVARELRGSRPRPGGDRDVVLHAQCHAQNFYARAGFVPEGEVYDEAGIDHIPMRRVL